MEDFALEESGRRQTIRYFSRDPDTPRTIGILIDAGASQRRVFAQVHQASYSFLDRVLRIDRDLEGDLKHQDRAFVVQFDSRSELKQTIEPGLRQLQNALRNGQLVEGRQLAAKPLADFSSERARSYTKRSRLHPANT